MVNYMSMRGYVGGHYRPYASYRHYAPAYGFYQGGTVFAYGAASRMCRRVAYYENYMRGYWGGNPAAYYIDALGTQARSVARPGGAPPVAGNAQAAGQTAPAKQQGAGDTAQTNAKTGEGGEAKETEADRKARAKQEARDQQVEESKNKLDSLKKTMPSKLVNEYGYSEDEAKKIVEMIHDKVKDAGVNAPQQFANYLNGVPKKSGKGEDGKPIGYDAWASAYARWVAAFKGADKPEQAAVDATCEIKSIRGKKLADDAAYARIEQDGIRKIGGTTYDRYRVVKKAGNATESAIGAATTSLYYDQRTKKWGVIEGGAFRALRTQPKDWNQPLGLLSFDRGRLVPVPKKNLSAIDINAAIDAWISGRKTGTDGNAVAARARDIKQRLEQFFGLRNGQPPAKVEIVDGRNISIVMQGKTEEEKGRNAGFIQERILAGKGRFNAIANALASQSAMTLNASPVDDVQGSRAADNAVSILAKTAIKSLGPIDVRRGGSDPDKAFVDARADKGIIFGRIGNYLTGKGYGEDDIAWTRAKKVVITLRFGKAPDAAAIKEIEAEINKQLKNKGRSCTVELRVVVVSAAAQPRDHKVLEMLKLVHWAANGSGDALATEQEKRLREGSTDPTNPGLPFEPRKAQAIAYKALKKKALAMHEDRRADRINDTQLNGWMARAKAAVKAYKGEAEAARFASEAAREPEPEPAPPPVAVTSRRRVGRRGGPRVRRGVSTGTRRTRSRPGGIKPTATPVSTGTTTEALRKVLRSVWRSFYDRARDISPVKAVA